MKTAIIALICLALFLFQNLEVHATSQDDLEAGKVSYVTYCSSCHGVDGKGSGPLASELRSKPANLTALTQSASGVFPKSKVRAVIDGREIFAAHGSREMPLWGEMFVFESTGGGVAVDQEPETTNKHVDNRIDQLVTFIQSIQE